MILTSIDDVSRWWDIREEILETKTKDLPQPMELVEEVTTNMVLHRIFTIERTRLTYLQWNMLTQRLICFMNALNSAKAMGVSWTHPRFSTLWTWSRLRRTRMHMCRILRSSIGARKRFERWRSGMKNTMPRKFMTQIRLFSTSTKVWTIWAKFQRGIFRRTLRTWTWYKERSCNLLRNRVREKLKMLSKRYWTMMRDRVRLCSSVQAGKN